MRRLRPHLTYANVVATLCLFIVLGGTGYAASKISGKRIKSRSIAQRALKNRTITRAKIRRHTLTGVQIRNDSLGNDQIDNAGLEAAHAVSADRATRAASAARSASSGHADTADSAASADSATSADDAKKLGGTAAAEYRTYDGTLPSGKSESGDFGTRAPTAAPAPGFQPSMDQSVTFTTPLAARVPGANIVYTKLPSADPHCSGPGHADPGFLCIYEVNSTSVAGKASVFAFENQNPQNESGNFGFNMEWLVNGATPFAIGTYTVTAP